MPNDRQSRLSGWALGLAKITVIAAAYALAGRASLLLAIPPGYSTAVWPAAGIALAAILLYGYRFWPGVMLGSFLINIWTTLDVHNTDTLPISLAIAGSIGIGAALQAVLGAVLIRRFVGFPTGLISNHEVGAFLTLGGPLACIVAATWGVGTLWQAGVIPLNALAQNWATWWVGDTIGVLIFTPLVMIWSAQPRAIWEHRKLSVALPLCITFAVAVAVFSIAKAWENERVRREFEGRTQVLHNAIEKSFGDYSEVLHNLSSCYMSSVEVTRDEFRQFVQFPLRQHPDILGLSWNPRITADQRDDFERTIREQGQADFQITEQDEQGRSTAAPSRPHYYPVLYMEPYEMHRAAIGFNVLSEPTRRLAMEQAADTGEPTATSPLRLVQDASQPGTLIFMPIYAKNATLDTREDRRRNIAGYVVGAFRFDSLIDQALRGVDRMGVGLSVYDETEEFNKQPLYSDTPSTSAGSTQAYNPDDYALTIHYPVAGRKWAIHFAPTLEFIAQQQTWHTWAVLAGGLLFTSLLGGFLLALSGRGAAETHRNRELARVNAALEHEVAERSAAELVLREKTVELERFNRLTMGREMRVIELKREVNDLMHRLGEEPRYKAVDTNEAPTA